MTYKHRVLFKNKPEDAGGVHIGDVVSFNDMDHAVPLPSSLVFEKIVKIAELPQFDPKLLYDFFLGVKTDVNENKKLIDLREFLKSNQHKVAWAKITNSSGTLNYEVVILPASIPDKTTYSGYDKGFRVLVLNKPKEIVVDDGPRYSPVYDYNNDHSNSHNSISIHVDSASNASMTGDYTTPYPSSTSNLPHTTTYAHLSHPPH
ncbi:hypothetical protein EON65_40285, partial [archaeon]